MISGLEEANEGDILYENKSFIEYKSLLYKNVGTCDQEIILFDNLRVCEHIEYFLEIKKKKKKRKK